MGTLAWCANYALGWKKLPLGPLSFFAGSVGVLILVSLEEFSQYWIPTRTCEWKDLLADVLGIFLIGRLRFNPQSAIPNPQSP
jgi:VanZ family protein